MKGTCTCSAIDVMFFLVNRCYRTKSTQMYSQNLIHKISNSYLVLTRKEKSNLILLKALGSFRSTSTKVTSSPRKLYDLKLPLPRGNCTISMAYTAISYIQLRTISLARAYLRPLVLLHTLVIVGQRSHNTLLHSSSSRRRNCQTEK